MAMAMAMAKVRPIDDTYSDVEKLIYKVVNEFMRRHGGEFEELLSTANEVFMDAYLSWKAGMAPFTNFLSICIYRRLLGEKRKRMKMPLKSLVDKEGANIEVEDKHREFNEAGLVDGLSSVAKELVGLVLHTPDALAAAVRAKGDKDIHYSSTIKEYLYSMGWSRATVRSAWGEVTGALGLEE